MAGPINSKIPSAPFNNTETEGEVVSEPGTIIGSAKAISVKNIGAVAGTFDGLPIEPGEVFNYPWCGKTFDNITYDATDTQFKLIVFR